MARQWPLSALFAVTVWGGSFVATKIALGPAEARVFTPFGLVALRFLQRRRPTWGSATSCSSAAA
jgi:drug/metabolite transporter (DMT)-like permease